MKASSKGSVRPVDNEITTPPTSNGKIQGQKQKSRISPYSLKHDKEHEFHNTAQNITNSKDLVFKNTLRKGSNEHGKSVKTRGRISCSSVMKELGCSKALEITDKSSSPPPLPPPSHLVSSDTMGITNTSHNPEIKVGKIKLAQSGRNKQQVCSKKNYRNYTRWDLRENTEEPQFSTTSVLQNETCCMEQRNNEMSLPYDSEFCCDDDKFHFVENDCLKDALVVSMTSKKMPCHYLK